MKIRFLKDEGPYAPGDVIDTDMDGVAALYVERGVAEYVVKVPAGFAERQDKLLKAAKVKVKA